MKRIMSRSLIIFVVAIAFFAGLCLLGFRVVTQNEMWAQQPYNGHMASANGLINAGEITDRNGEVLAYTDEEPKRVYHTDLNTRTSLLHVVGDDSLNISTAIQSMYRGNLTGYSFIWGLGLPESMKGSSDVQLTVDANSCKAAYEAFNGKKGACVVYNYKTGEILCDVSTPSYDPQNPPEITEENEEEYRGVYLDNVVSSTYTPGSIFKIVTSAAAIEYIDDIYDRTFVCEGAYEIDGKKITCESAHGYMDIETAFAHSCNIAYAQMAVEVGEERMTEVATQMGFNKEFQVNGITLAQSKYSLDSENAYGDNQLAWSGIGQFEDLANPMHMAIMCGAIANGGTPQAPYLFEETSLLSAIGLQGSKDIDQMLSYDTAVKVQELMRGAANYYYNARGLTFGNLNFCAKTGTAEVSDDKEPNAWIIGYIEDENHPYAFAVVVEEGGYGISAASPVAQAAINELLK